MLTQGNVGNLREPTRVLILTQYFPPEMGAPQARLSELGERLIDRGWEVEALTALPNYPTGKVFAEFDPGTTHTHMVGRIRTVRVPLYIFLSEGILSVDEAVQYQIDRVPTMEEHISRAEVDMYVRWPYQATSYIVGKKQIEQILGDLIKANDFSIDWRAFHDELLDYGQIAPALIRWEMTGNDDQVSQFWNDPETPGGD